MSVIEVLLLLQFIGKTFANKKLGKNQILSRYQTQLAQE
jgi:hypothetical protein